MNWGQMISPSVKGFSSVHGNPADGVTVLLPESFSDWTLQYKAITFFCVFIGLKFIFLQDALKSLAFCFGFSPVVAAFLSYKPVHQIVQAADNLSHASSSSTI